MTFTFGLTTAHTAVYYVGNANANNTRAGIKWATAQKDIQNTIDLKLGAENEVWLKINNTINHPGTGGLSQLNYSDLVMVTSHGFSYSW